MKKILSIFCAIIIAASLTACNSSTEPDSSTSDTPSDISDISNGNDSSDQSDDSSSSNTSSVIPAPASENDPLPRMDGSTSAIPLEIGLRSGFLGIPYSDAKAMVSHTTTHDSFKRLINGEVDLIFSVPISAEQQKAADDAGVKLFMEPVAREGFVFVVNANNPVDSLTSDQLRKIYSGEITNWSQVGGNNEPILPYQRNTDSGSQNYMTVFMGDTPLLEPKVEFVAGGMSGIMDAVAVYDNSAGAIGYSVYSYAAQMYANANKVKFIAVDGVAPSKATMADESYPLLSCTYLIYTDKSPESAKEFVERALSDEGQTYVLESGYLPVNGMDVPEKYLPYEAVGTGEPRPADYSRFDKYSSIYLYVKNDDSKPVIEKSGKIRLNFLKDTKLQDSINADISSAIERLDRKVTAKFECYNGYLSIILTCDVPNVYNTYSKAETLNYDLFSGKKIERFSDLFYKDENFLPGVNDRMASELSAQADNSFYFTENIPKIDFSGILGEPQLFTITSVGLEPNNLYFVYGQFVKYSDFNNFQGSDFLCVAMQYRDMAEIIRDEFVPYIIEDSYRNEWETKYVSEENGIFLRFVGSKYHTPEEVTAQDKFWYELQCRRAELLTQWIPDYRPGGMIRYGKNGNYYYVRNSVNDSDSDFGANFDADTLEIITLEMLIGKDWQQYLTEQDEFFSEYELYPSYWLYWNENENVTVLAYPNSPTEWFWRPAHLSVPKEKINKRYLTPQN